MSELYSGTDAPSGSAVARPPQITPSDAAGIQSLYGGGLTDRSDLFICSVDGSGVPYPVAPALRRVAPPGVVVWDVIDVDGDGLDEIITWPASSDPGTSEIQGRGICVYHFGEMALLERAEGPARGMIDPGRPLLLRDGLSRVRTGELGYRIGDAPITPMRFSSDGLPITPAERREDIDERWWIGGSLAPHPLRDLDGDGQIDRLIAGEPDAEGRRGFRFADEEDDVGEGNTRPVSFHARAAIPADVDGDGIMELIVQGLE